MSTADFFTPIVDDPRTWGAISAANAVSDVYAMGAVPLFALNLVVWPRELLDLDLLGEVMAGGAEVAQRGGWVIAGGHTVDGPEPMYGQSVTGEVDPLHMMTNAGAKAGEALVLTKPIGTGLLATAIKRSEPSAIAEGGALAKMYRLGVAEMMRLNDVAASVAAQVRSRAGTDVTGFGLLGHLHRMCLASGVGAEIDAGAVPTLPGVFDLIDAGLVPGGTLRNLEHVRPWVTGESAEHSDQMLVLLADAQTSGGLLFSCDPTAAEEAIDILVGAGHDAARVGEIVEAEPGSLRLG